MPSVSGPAVLAAGLSAAGSIGGALIGGNSQSQAIDAQNRATQMQIQEMQREFDLGRGDLAPWRTTGGSALDQLAKIYGLDTSVNGKTVPGTGKSDMSGFFTSPDYNFRKSEGLSGIDAGAAARGSLDSGATRKAEIGYAGNLASGEYGSYVNRLLGIAGLGQTSSAQSASNALTTGQYIGNAYENQGNNLASSYLAQGKTYADAVSGVANIGSGLIARNPQWFG